MTGSDNLVKDFWDGLGQVGSGRGVKAMDSVSNFYSAVDRPICSDNTLIKITIHRAYL